MNREGALQQFLVAESFPPFAENYTQDNIAGPFERDEERLNARCFYAVSLIQIQIPRRNVLRG